MLKVREGTNEGLECLAIRVNDVADRGGDGMLGGPWTMEV